MCVFALSLSCRLPVGLQRDLLALIESYFICQSVVSALSSTRTDTRLCQRTLFCVSRNIATGDRTQFVQRDEEGRYDLLLWLVKSHSVIVHNRLTHLT